MRRIGLMWLLLGGVALAGGRARWAPRSTQVEAYNTAVQALESSAPGAAERLLRPALEADPGCGVCAYTLSLALVRQQRPEEALELLDTLRERHPRPEVLSLAAVAAVAAGRPEEAQASAARALALDPAAAPARQVLVQVLLLQGELEAAQQVADEALIHLPAPRAACLRAEVALARERLDEARAEVLACQALDDPQTRQEMALKLAQAEGDLETVLQLSGTLQQPALRSKAEAVRLLRADQPDAALPLLVQVLAQNPSDADALLLRALAFQAAGEPSRALNDLELLLDLAPAAVADRYGGLSVLQGWRGLRRRASGLYVALLIEDGRLYEARAHLDAAWQTEGDGAPLHAAEVRLRAAEGQPERALQALVAANARWPDDDALALAAVALDGSVPLPPELLAWLQVRPDPGPLLQLATQRYHDGLYAESAAALAPLRAHPDPAIRQSVALLRHRCAVAAEDLPGAEGALEALRSAGAAPSAEALLRHAWLLGEAGRESAALAMLAELGLQTAAQQDQRRSLQVWLLTRLGRLEEALALSGTGAVEPAQRADLAAALYEAGRHREARTLMQRACAELPEGPQADRCAQALSLMR